MQELPPLGGGLSGKLRPETDSVMAKLALKTELGRLLEETALA